jgi:hypothetical protein
MKIPNDGLTRVPRFGTRRDVRRFVATAVLAVAILAAAVPLLILALPRGPGTSATPVTPAPVNQKTPPPYVLIAAGTTWNITPPDCSQTFSWGNYPNPAGNLSGTFSATNATSVYVMTVAQARAYGSASGPIACGSSSTNQTSSSSVPAPVSYLHSVGPTVNGSLVYQLPASQNSDAGWIVTAVCPSGTANCTLTWTSDLIETW